MNIKCPSCHFDRNVPDANLRPGKTYKVTCPRCSSIFHFSVPEPEFIIEVEPDAEPAESVQASAPAEAVAPAVAESEKPGAKYEVAGYALPEAANFDRERMTRFINSDCNIGMGFMTPPPFVYPFWTVGLKGWAGIGLIAREGQYNFNRLW